MSTKPYSMPRIQSVMAEAAHTKAADLAAAAEAGEPITADSLTAGSCFIGITPNGVPNEYIIYRDALGRTRLVNPERGSSKYEPHEVAVDTIYELGSFDATPMKIAAEPVPTPGE